MAILLLVLLVLAGLIVGDAIVENTGSTTITLAGQELTGLTLGGWLAVFAVLGFVSAFLLLGILAAARRSRVRRRALRSNEREMADRVAELERENTVLREQTVDTDETPHRQPVRDDTLVDKPSRARLDERTDDRAVATDAGYGTTRDRTDQSAMAREHSAVDDYPPSTTHDAQRDRWPEPVDEQAPRDRPARR